MHKTLIGKNNYLFLGNYFENTPSKKFLITFGNLISKYESLIDKIFP
jgi:hypothetical protein